MARNKRLVAKHLGGIRYGQKKRPGNPAMGLKLPVNVISRDLYSNDFTLVRREGAPSYRTTGELNEAVRLTGLKLADIQEYWHLHDFEYRFPTYSQFLPGYADCGRFPCNHEWVGYRNVANYRERLIEIHKAEFGTDYTQFPAHLKIEIPFNLYSGDEQKLILLAHRHDLLDEAIALMPANLDSRIREQINASVAYFLKLDLL